MKIIILLIALASLLFVCSAVTNVADCTGLKALTSADVDIHLTADIDCNGEVLTPITNLHTASFDGHGFKICNFSINFPGSAALFTMATNSYFTNFTLADFTVTGDDLSAALVGYSISSNFSYISFNSSILDTNTVNGRNKAGALVGAASNTNFFQIRLRRSYIKGRKDVGGMVGTTTGHGTTQLCVNYAYELQPSRSIVKGKVNVGGLIGFCESTVIQSGIENGKVSGKNKVGALIGNALNIPELSELFTRPEVTVVAWGEDASAGGIAGRYGIEANGAFKVLNSYAKAKVVSSGPSSSKSNAGGLFGNVDLDTNFVITLSFTDVYAANIVSGTAAHLGKIFGYYQLDAGKHTVTFVNTLTTSDINATLPIVGEQPTARGSPFAKRSVFVNRGANSGNLTGVDAPYEYVAMVDQLVKNADQDNVWCHDRLRIESEFYTRHNVCRCGINSPEFDGTGEPLCLCSHFTELSHFNGSFCINSTQICTPPDGYYVTATETLLLDIAVSDVSFDEVGRLVVVLNYATHVTGWTDIIVTGGGAFTEIASLSTYLDGREHLISSNGAAEEDWFQHIDKYTGPACRQQATFKLPWHNTTVTLTAQDAFESGNFSFFIFGETHILREATHVVLKRDVLTANALLITAVPLYIHLNTTITTNATVTSNFTLGFDINITYYIRETDIDYSGNNLTVVLRHTVSNPFSLIVTSTSALVAGSGASLSVTRLSNVTVACDPDFDLEIRPSNCEQETTFLIILDPYLNCTDQTIDFTFFMEIHCDGPNENTTSTLCSSVYDQIPVKDATATVSFDYNFCPKIEDTSLSPFEFNLTQNGSLILEKGEVEEECPINGTIVFLVQEYVNGSVFSEGRITSLVIKEKYPGPNSVEFVDVTSDMVDEPVFEAGANYLAVKFSYTPDFLLLTTFLQEWFKGLYFEAVVQVAYKPPSAKRSIGDSPYETSVRLELPIAELEHVRNSERIEHSLASSGSFLPPKHLKRKPLPKIVKKLVPSTPSNLETEIAAEKNRLSNMKTIIGASVGVATIVVAVACVLVVAIFLNSNKNNQVSQENKVEEVKESENQELEIVETTQEIETN